MFTVQIAASISARQYKNVSICIKILRRQWLEVKRNSVHPRALPLRVSRFFPACKSALNTRTVACRWDASSHVTAHILFRCTFTLRLCGAALLRSEYLAGVRHRYPFYRLSAPRDFSISSIFNANKSQSIWLSGGYDTRWPGASRQPVVFHGDTSGRRSGRPDIDTATVQLFR